MSFTDQFIETGTILLYAGPSDNIPDGYLLCDGSTINKSDYPTLFSVLVLTNGSNATSTQLPNLEEKFIQGKTPVTSDISYAGSASADISNIHMPNHKHDNIDPNSVTWHHTHDVNLNINIPTSISSDSANASGSVQEMQAQHVNFPERVKFNNKEITNVVNPTVLSVDLSNNYTSVDTLNKYIVLNYIIKT
jgi:microcystin-dependent protein